MGQAAVWTIQVPWPILPRAVRTALLVLVSSSYNNMAYPVFKWMMI